MIFDRTGRYTWRSDVGDDVLIDDGLGNTINLLQVQLSDLDANDFVF